MAKSLKEQMASDVNDVFLAADSDGEHTEFAEKLTLYREGTPGRTHSFSGIVVPDALVGSREATGDGVILEGDWGHKERSSIAVEMPVSVPVQDPQGLHPDTLEWNNEQWVAIRILERDDNMMTVLFVRTESTYTEMPPKR